MILTIMFLLVATLQTPTPTIVTTFSPEQPTIVATLQQPDLSGVSVPLVQPDIKGVPLKPAQITIVKTWTID